MLVLRLLVMVLTIICLMDGHAEVSSSTTGIRDRRESPAVKTNDSEVQIHDRKKKKKPKPSKKKKTKPGKKKKPNKAKPTPTKPVTTTPTVSTSTLKTTKILTTPTITTTTPTVSPTTTATTTKTTTSTASATTTLSTTTSATTTLATSSTASTATTTIPITATTSSLPTTAATTADSGAGGECKATNGKPCIFPFKDGKEYNECKNEGGKYFWCATSVYDSGKYKHWSYCPEDRSCPLEGDGECRAENNKPCVFPFKDGEKEYNVCADHGGQYFWCATGTNSAGKYTAWSKCPKDGSCPLPQKSSTPVITPTATAAITSPLTTGTTMPPMEKKVFSSLKDLVKEESKNDTFKMLQTMNEEMQAINEDLEGQRNIESDHGSGGNATILKKHSVGDEQDGDLIELRSYGENSEFTWSTFTYKGPTYLMGESNCCSACKKKWPDTLFFEYWAYFKKCWCYKKGSYGEPGIKYHNSVSTGKCDCRSSTTKSCPKEYTYLEGGFVEVPNDSKVLSKHHISTSCGCKKHCNVQGSDCLAFLFDTCSQSTDPRCILLNVNKPETNYLHITNYAFCKKNPDLVTFQAINLWGPNNHNKNQPQEQLGIFKNNTQFHTRVDNILKGLMFQAIPAVGKKITPPRLTQKLSNVITNPCAITAHMTNNQCNAQAILGEANKNAERAAAYMYSTHYGNVLNAFVDDMLTQNGRFKTAPDYPFGCENIEKKDEDTHAVIALHLQSFLFKNPDEKQQTVYRRTVIFDTDAQKKTGETFFTSKFLSTSKSKTYIEDAKVQVTIHLKYWGTTLKDLTMKEEEEVLVPYMVKFRVVSVTENNGMRFLVWEEV